VPAAASVLSVKLTGLPEGVTVERGRIEVRFDGAREAVGRLFALAQALTNDYDRFEDRGGRHEGSVGCRATGITTYLTKAAHSSTRKQQ
jgi:hypothetical protein